MIISRPRNFNITFKTFQDLSAEFKSSAATFGNIDDDVFVARSTMNGDQVDAFGRRESFSSQV